MIISTRIMRALRCSVLLAATGCATHAPASYPYGGFLPARYAAAATQRFPMIVFLHGAVDTNPQEKMIPAYATDQPDFPFIVITPRASRDWSVERLDAMLAEVETRFRVDPTRIYLTGLSMGGVGAWKLAAAHPEKFAGLTIIAASGDRDPACRLKGLPVWLIHNRDDDVIPVRRSQELADALAACGTDVRLTINDHPAKRDWPHDAWSDVYTTGSLYAWFLSHSR